MVDIFPKDRKATGRLFWTASVQVGLGLGLGLGLWLCMPRDAKVSVLFFAQHGLRLAMSCWEQLHAIVCFSP